MSVDASKAVIRAFVEAWNEMNLAVVDEIFAPDYAVNGSLVPPEIVKKAVAGLHAVFGHPVLTVEEIVAEDDRIAVRWLIRGVHSETFMGVPATGKDVTLSGINIYRLADGKIKENHETVDIYGLLQQIGGAANSRLGVDA